MVQSVDLGNAVADLDDVTDFILFGFDTVMLNLILNDLHNFIGFQVHVFTYFTQLRWPDFAANLPAGPAGCRPTAPQQNAR